MNFSKAIRFFKSVSKSKYPIKVRRKVIKEAFHGFCEKKEDHFLIIIDKNLSEAHAIDILMHEVAHADSWAEGINHDLDWAISYRRLYQLWEKHIT